nr:unnamed protein product [Callosobruchus chinensis]
MVLKVEDDEPYGETKPILGTSGTSDAEESDLRIHEVYRNITSSMKTDPLTIDKPAVALDLFSTAVHVRNAALAKQCIEILNNHLNKRDVLLILKHLSKCRSDTGDSYDTEPSAPPMDEAPDEDWVQDLVDNLRYDNIYYTYMLYLP